MKIKALMLIASPLIISLTACSQSSNTNALEQIKLEEAKQEINYTIETGTIHNFIEDSFSGKDIDKYKDILTDKYYSKLKEEQSFYEESDYAGGHNDSYYEPTEEGYPIIGDNGEVVGYGTKEESETSIKEYEEKPIAKITGETVYKDFIIVRVDVKGAGLVAYGVRLVDSKVDNVIAFNSLID